MAVTITIGGAASDSYATEAEYASYVVANIDATFTADETADAIVLRRAAQYIDRKNEASFIGIRQYQTQALEWPRLTGDLVRGYPVNPDIIPQSIKDAQMELARQIQTGEVAPFESVSGVIKSEKLGPMETEYAGGLSTPRLTAINDALRPYLKAAGQARAVRG